jgi:DNA processing protein
LPEASGDRRGWPKGFGRTVADREALLVLAHLERMIPRDLYAMAWRRGTASRCLEIVRREGSTTDRSIAETVDPRVVGERLRTLGARAITPADDEYPSRLLALADPPACLFVRGRPLSKLGTAVAVVGARSCSPYGRDAAINLASQLALAGVTVVSGAALGVDGASHEGALRAGGHTVAVLGSGIDRPHPFTNEGLIERIAAQGTVVSEYPPGAEPWPRRFPQRNRIIAGLSQGVIVVEGAAGSGSLQTADFSEGLDREVMAVPGPIDSSLSQAPHELIRHGAALVADADDVLDALGLFDRDAGPPPPPPALDDGDHEGRVLAILSGRPASLEAVATASGLPMERALVVLSGLELRGLAEAQGGRYRRAPPQPRRERQTSSRPDSASRARSAEGG